MTKIKVFIVIKTVTHPIYLVKSKGVIKKQKQKDSALLYIDFLMQDSSYWN